MASCPKSQILTNRKQRAILLKNSLLPRGCSLCSSFQSRPFYPNGRGRLWRSCREVMNGVLWALRMGTLWRDLPAQFPRYPTCYRRLQLWSRSGVLEQVLFVLAQHLKQHGELDITECAYLILRSRLPERSAKTDRGRPSVPFPAYAARLRLLVLRVEFLADTSNTRYIVRLAYNGLGGRHRMTRRPRPRILAFTEV